MGILSISGQRYLWTIPVSLYMDGVRIFQTCVFECLGIPKVSIFLGKCGCSNNWMVLDSVQSINPPEMDAEPQLVEICRDSC